MQQKRELLIMKVRKSVKTSHDQQFLVKLINFSENLMLCND